jgi:hypothetical protein
MLIRGSWNRSQRQAHKEKEKKKGKVISFTEYPCWPFWIYAYVHLCGNHRFLKPQPNTSTWKKKKRKKKKRAALQNIHDGLFGYTHTYICVCERERKEHYHLFCWKWPSVNLVVVHTWWPQLIPCTAGDQDSQQLTQLSHQRNLSWTEEPAQKLQKY